MHRGDLQKIIDHFSRGVWTNREGTIKHPWYSKRIFYWKHGLPDFEEGKGPCGLEFGKRHEEIVGDSFLKGG